MERKTQALVPISPEVVRKKEMLYNRALASSPSACRSLLLNMKG
jgi:hypothetical protein